MRRRLVTALVLAAVALGVTAGPVGAHVDLEPGEALAGTRTTLTFSFRHGKDGSATTALEVRLPEGATVVEVPSVAGFDSVVDVDARTVRWAGGSVPDGTEAAFPVVIDLPATPGVALFPTIQETEAGELAWISEEEGEGEGVQPAPRLTLLPDPDATPSTSTTATESPTSTTAQVTTSTVSDLPGTTLEAQERDSGDTSPAPWVIGSGIAALAAVAIGGTLLKRRAD